jgi:transcriptional regulator with XRE-family HTH domain
LLQLTRERRARGWSQAELARRAKLDQSTLSKIESGWLRPYPRQLRRLARALGVPPEVAPGLLAQVGGIGGSACAAAEDNAWLRAANPAELPDDAA